ncbi:hypothetical protein FHW17_002816 [Phyllobacterium sp. P30BS-XVII]|nr:hypothetical protein [Phyllobacterium sp. P30BS-XVII]
MVAKCDQLCPLTALKIGCNVTMHILVDVEGLRFNKKAIEFS